jgi:hypothetical protein
LAVVYCDVARLPQRRADDVYETDRRSAALGIDLLTGRPERALDPSSGSGIYGELMRNLFPGMLIDGVELRDLPRPAAYDGWAGRTSFQEFATEYGAAGGPLYDAIVTNPPFALLDQFVELAWPLLAPGGELVFLTQLRYLEGQKRAKRIWGPMAPREVLILTKRPSFQADGKSSPAAFCYVAWQKRDEGSNNQPVLRWALPEREAGK